MYYFFSDQQSCILNDLITLLDEEVNVWQMWESAVDNNNSVADSQYYMNTITGVTTWEKPSNWSDLIDSWNGWLLCCEEDQPNDYYW